MKNTDDQQICSLPAITVNTDVISVQKGRGIKRHRKKHKHCPYSEESLISRTKELVREDVYLMDNKNRRVHANLLANSLTARLRRNLPDDVDMDAMNKIRRESLKDFKHLDNLNKQYTSEMNLESSRLDKETFQMLKRHKQLKRQSECQRRQQDKMESVLRSRSGLSSASILPRLVDSEASTLFSPTKEILKDEFPEFAAVDKDDMSRVKVFKLHGVYQPQNKYNSSRIESLNIPPKAKKDLTSNDLQESLRLADSGSPIDLPPKSRMSRKGLRVSWSRQSRFYSNSDGYSDTDSVTTSRADTRVSNGDTNSEARTPNPDREENMKTPSTTKSFKSFKSTKSESYLIKKAPRRSKIETIGLNWKITPGAKPTDPPPVVQKPVPKSLKAPTGTVSHNLNPVTTAMSKEGMLTSKVRWHVQKVQSMSTIQMYKTWLEKLEELKGKEGSIESSVHKIPNRANLSVMTQPA